MARGEGVTVIFSCIRRLGSFFGVQNFEFRYFWGHHKIGLYLGVISLHFRVFSKG